MNTMFRRWLPHFLLALLSAASLLGYLLVSFFHFRIGFPLDDAWIHQTYARNLAQLGEWAFLPGQPSAGSTAPLWSALLAAGYGLHVEPHVWTYLLGWVLLSALAIVGWRTFGCLYPERTGFAPWAGVFLALEWHLVWAAGSGMETLLFALMVLVILTELVNGHSGWWRLGLLIGISVWVRPDGLTLLGPALMTLFFSENTWKGRLRSGAWLGLGVVLLAAPYLVFNHLLAGAWWPNTFFAKQVEYADYRQIPLWQRFVAQASLPLVGAGALLLPGFGFYVWQAMRQRAWASLAGMVWLLGYLLLYALLLPVTYQHGRYVMPAMPVYFLWGLVGLATWVRPAAPGLWRRSLGKAWLASLGLVIVFFWIMGARAYAQDVAIIESEMVTTARWVAEHTDPNAVVAAHDIGALGYFGERKLLDLAGLISPDLIPIVRDEARLETYLDAQKADYLVTFPAWYPDLIRHGRLVFKTYGRFSPAAGGENMAVYEWIVAPGR